MKADEQRQPADQLVIFAIKLYQDKGYDVLYSSVVVNAIYCLYEKYVQSNQLPPIEVLSPEKKTEFWEIAKRYYQDQASAIKASKAAYIINVITSEN